MSRETTNEEIDMISFRQSIINQIKAAANEAEVAIVIEDSLQRLKIKNVNGHLIERFISGMNLALGREQIEHHTTTTKENISSAIAIIKKKQGSKAST